MRKIGNKSLLQLRRMNSCKNGHRYTDEDTIQDSKSIICKICEANKLMIDNTILTFDKARAIVENHYNPLVKIEEKGLINNEEDNLIRRVKRYKLSVNDYNKLFKEQNGKCAICGIHQSELKKSLHIDHCHDEGHIRGLLCQQCNHGLGLFKDNILLLDAAINYIIKSKAK